MNEGGNFELADSKACKCTCCQSDPQQKKQVWSAFVLELVPPSWQGAGERQMGGLGPTRLRPRLFSSSILSGLCQNQKSVPEYRIVLCIPSSKHPDRRPPCARGARMPGPGQLCIPMWVSCVWSQICPHHLFPFVLHSVVRGQVNAAWVSCFHENKTECFRNAVKPTSGWVRVGSGRQESWGSMVREQGHCQPLGHLLPLSHRPTEQSSWDSCLHTGLPLGGPILPLQLTGDMKDTE